ncbi:site-specific integrase [Kitasatospora purpeofusca]|uniref:site-specific integrase n=1 Tax=Kitasatospora purpeofusca TaxID=67352 RepID=UPI002E13A9C4|nr:site-specific integrase [Kitasatospora purpeofusca]
MSRPSKKVGTVLRRCTCREPVRDEAGRPVLDAHGKPKSRELGSRCPKLKGKKAHGTWGYYLPLPPGPDGKPNRDRRFGFEDKDKAEAALAEVIGKSTRAEVIDHRTTVAQFLNKWLEGKKKLEPTTVASYASHIRLYLIPALGHIKLEDLTAQPIRDMFDAIEARNIIIAFELALIAKARAEYAEWKKQFGRKPGRPKAGAQPPPVAPPEIPKREPHPQMRIVEPATMHRIRATLRSALTQAVKELRIPTNWASLVDLPSGKRPKALLWTPEQAGRFLDAIETDWLRAFWHLAIFRGLRRGEGAGLEWAKTSLDTAVLTVDWQIVTVGGKPQGKKPKADSVRTIALDSHTLQELRDHRDRMAEARQVAAEAGLPWPTVDSVFVREDGEEINPDYLTDRFEPLCTRLGLPPVRLHDLRHLAATLLLGAGADLKVVQEVLGHSTIVLTADTYTSVLPSLDRENAEKAAALVPVTNRRTATQDAFVLDLGGLEVATATLETAEALATEWNARLRDINPTTGLRPVETPAEPVQWTGEKRLWERVPRQEVVHLLMAGLDRHSGTLLFHLPVSSRPAWEFERELFTDQAAVLSIELRLGLRGPIEVIARGTDLAAVEGAFAQGLQQAAQLYARLGSDDPDTREAA